MTTDQHPSDFGMLVDDGRGPPTHGDLLAATINLSRKMDRWIDDSVAWRTEHEKRQESFAVELRQNTQETIEARVEIKAVRDGMATFRTIKIAAGWLGGVAIAIVAVWQLIKLIVTGDLPPPGP